ncbi:MAG: hypothetical protein OEY10_05395 [Nitrosopumilus sp.]|nr:hypothetical protein [Nitrosopumilus sp.]
MKTLLICVLSLMFFGCSSLPNVMVEDKKTGNLVGCKTVGEIQVCEYEDDRFKFTAEFPKDVEPPKTMEK